MNYMKNTTSILVMLVLIVGMLPLSLGQSVTDSSGSVTVTSSDTNGDTHTNTENEDSNTIDNNEMSDDGPRADSDDDGSRIQKRSDRIEQSRERLQNARENLQEARQKRQDMREAFQNKREALQEAKERRIDLAKRLKELCGQNNQDNNPDSNDEDNGEEVDTPDRVSISEDGQEHTMTCKEVRREAKDLSKRFFSEGATERLLNAIDTLIDRIENSNLSDDEKENILTTLENHKESIFAIQEKAQALDSETLTREDIMSLTDELKEVWKKLQEDLKDFAKKAVADKYSIFVNRVDNALEKFDTALEALSDYVDTSEAQNLLEESKEKLNAVEEELKALRNNDAEAQDVHAKIEEAKEVLMELHRVIESLKEEARDSANNAA